MNIIIKNSKKWLLTNQSVITVKEHDIQCKWRKKRSKPVASVGNQF